MPLAFDPGSLGSPVKPIGGITGPTDPGLPPSPGSGSSAIIPDAGVYGSEQAAALNAYNNAVAAATAQRNSLYNQYGLLNNGQVDPNNPYGQYQQMLGAQASQFSADQEDAAGRNLGVGGLANKQLGLDQNAGLAQDFGFQQQAGQVGTDYNQALQDASTNRSNADSQAYNDAINTALTNMLTQMQSGNYTQAAPAAAAPAPKTPAKSVPKAKPKPRHRQPH